MRVYYGKKKQPDSFVSNRNILLSRFLILNGSMTKITAATVRMLIVLFGFIWTGKLRVISAAAAALAR